jgi:HK97 family phage portal protein
MPNSSPVPAAGPRLLARMAATVRGLMGIGPFTSRPGPMQPPAGPSGLDGVSITQSGMIPNWWPWNHGQSGFDPVVGGMNSVVYSCIMLYARTIAQLPGHHMRQLANNGQEELRNTPLANILRKPNSYQTRSDFMYNMVVALLDDGNSYALALRDANFRVTSMHQLRSRNTRPFTTQEGDIFYAVGTNQVLESMPEWWADPMRQIEGRYIVPERDMMHWRAWCPLHPLIGESPLIAAAIPIMAQGQGLGSMARYYENMSRPSGILQTDLILTKDQVTELRARWNEQASGAAIGGTPILTAGLKWTAAGEINAANAQIAEMLKYSTADIARVFGVPLAMINDMSGATYNNTEQLIMTWLRMGLNFYLEHIELNFDKLFEIERGDEFTELDIKALLRPDFKTQVEGLVRAVTGGVYAPNEARAELSLKRVENGDEPRVQQQQVPLSWEPPEPAPPAAPVDPDDDDDPDPPDDDPAEDDPPPEKALSREDSRALARGRLAEIMKGQFHAAT